MTAVTAVICSAGSDNIWKVWKSRTIKSFYPHLSERTVKPVSIQLSE